MTEQQLLRYSRQIMLNEVDIQGQQRLLGSRALIIGAGGLGSPAALYLAAAGVGHLSIADDDRVDTSNLQRQIAHGEADLGVNKAHSAAEAVHALNRDCCVAILDYRLEAEALETEVDKADVVLDCTDRFASRYAINRACVAAGVPLVSGAAMGFGGQLAVFGRGDADSPCYACLYPTDGLVEEPLSCAESGVIAPLVGIIGSFQALEAVKLLAGAGQPHCGLSVFDGLRGEWRHFRVPKDPGCAVCGSGAS